MGVGGPQAVRTLAVTYPGGFSLGEHRHRWGQLIYGTRGVMRVATDASLWFVPPTRAVWVPAGCAHGIAMQGEVAMRTLYLAPARSKGLPAEVVGLEVCALLRELILHVLGRGMLHEAEAVDARLAAVLVDLVAAAPAHDMHLPLPSDPRALAAASLLQLEPASARALPAVATQAGTSLRTLQRLFARQTGMTLEVWRQKARLIHAVSQLSAGASVTEAGLHCGYDSTSAFVAAFKRQFGVTPGRFSLAAPSGAATGSQSVPR